jgi:hypothetical protein
MVPLGDRDTELHAVADLLLEGEPEPLGDPLPVKLFRGVLDCVELVDALLELDTVELCEEFSVRVLCTVRVGFIETVGEPLAETDPDSE